MTHRPPPLCPVDRERGRVDYMGLAVNAAALVQSKASGGQTLITEALYEQLLLRGRVERKSPKPFLTPSHGWHW